MSRNLDTSLAAALSASSISPVILAALTFVSGVMYVWSGVGNLVFNGNTYVGVGMLGKISPISESSDVRSDGMEITLSGIGLSPFTISNPSPPSGVTNPVSVPPGTYVAWSYPEIVVPVNNFPDGCTVTGSSGQNAAGFVNIFGAAFMTIMGQVSWTQFAIPELPDDAVITGIYPVGVAYESGIGDPDNSYFGVPVVEGTNPWSGQFNGTSLGTDLSVLNTYSIGVNTGNSIGGVQLNAFLGYSFVGIAIYYTSASNTANIIQEALNDFQAGAPAKIYFGLMSNGALIGNPYLIFSGQIDQPTIDMSTQTASITLALESKLTNLMRPTARRYTAADQHLAYPDDIGFNWVETLNDIALRWGS